MLESDFITSSWESDVFPDWILHDTHINSYENSDYSYGHNSDDRLSVLPSDFNSNSTEIDGFLDFKAYDSLPLSDAFVSQILGEDLFDNTSLDNFHDQQLSYSPNIRSSDVKTPKRKHLFHLSSKSWSSMSNNEKEKSLFKMSEISCKMGIKDQLTVIRIIDPNIEIDPNMKEFALDIALLNDTKWKRIKEFIKKHRNSIPLPNSSYYTSQSTSKSSKALHRKSSSFSRMSRKQKKQKNAPKAEEPKKFNRKQLKQGMKEEKSGLFVYEKVVKFSSLEEDEEDVNILE